jgi:hypothetical protein
MILHCVDANEACVFHRLDIRQMRRVRRCSPTTIPGSGTAHGYHQTEYQVGMTGAINDSLDRHNVTVGTTARPRVTRTNHTSYERTGVFKRYMNTQSAELIST